MGDLLRNYRDHWRVATPAARHYLFGAVLMGFSQAVTWSLLARYLEAHGFNKGEVGDVIASDAIGKALVALPAALWLARRSATTTFMASAFIGGGCYVLLPWIDGYWQLRALNLVAGMSLAVHYVMIAPFLFRHTAETERASIFGLAEATRTLASVVGALVAGGLVAWLMRRWLPGETGVLEGEALRLHNAAEARATGYAIMGAGFTAMLAAFQYRRITDGDKKGKRPAAAGEGHVLDELVRHRGTIARFAFPQLFVAAGSGFCIPFLPLYFKDRFQLAPEPWGQLFAGGQVLMTFGLLASPWVLARLGYVKSIVAIELLSLPFFLLLALSQSLPWAMAAFLLRGALMNSTHPIHKNLMMRATPSSVRELQTGINAILWGLGWYIGPKLGGQVLEDTGNNYAHLMYWTMGCYVLAAVANVVLLLPVERRSAAESAA
ncbi:MAG: MFS transporter [Planctomycetota bacterium]